MTHRATCAIFAAHPSTQAQTRTGQRTRPRSHHLRALLFGVCLLPALMVLSACPPAPYCTGGGGGAGRYKAPGSDTPLGLVGVPLVMSIDYPVASSGCATSSTTTKPTYTATVEVVDPKNVVVPASLDLGADNVARVQFTPSVPGPFHVTVRFEPGDALAQADAIIARDITGTAKLVGADCGNSLELIGGDTLVCGLEVFRGTDEVMSLQSGTVPAGSDGALWTIFSGQVQRFVDTGTGPLTNSPVGGASEGSTIRALQATSSELWVLDSGLSHYTAGSSAVTYVGSGVVADSAATILLVHGASQAVVSSDSVNQRVIACPYSSQATGISQAAGDCLTLAGTVAGTEPDGVWVYQDDVGTSAAGVGGVGSASGTLALWMLSDQGLFQAAKTHLQPPLTLVSSRGAEGALSGAPIVSYGRASYYGEYGASDGGSSATSTPLLVPHIENGDVVYDDFGTGPANFTQVHAGAVWTLLSSLPSPQTRIFRRTN